MTQSVELVLDPDLDAAVRAQWAELADAGLPTAQRVEPSPSHRPHVTLLALDALPDGADEALPALVAGLDLTVRVGAVAVFPRRRGTYVLVRTVLASAGLLALQQRVAAACGAPDDGVFGPGRWTPHVTLAPKIRADQVGAALDALAGGGPELAGRVAGVRRWDSLQKATWSLT